MINHKMCRVNQNNQSFYKQKLHYQRKGNKFEVLLLKSK